MSINELFRTQSGVKFKVREPVLNYLDKIITEQSYESYVALSETHKRKVVSMLLLALDRYCEADWIIDHRVAAMINIRLAEYLEQPVGMKTYLEAVDSPPNIHTDLLDALSFHVMNYYASYLDKYISEVAQRERVKSIIEKRKQQMKNLGEL